MDYARLQAANQSNDASVVSHTTWRLYVHPRDATGRRALSYRRENVRRLPLDSRGRQSAPDDKKPRRIKDSSGVFGRLKKPSEKHMVPAAGLEPAT